MLTYPQIDPVALALGPIKIHWYGIMYLVGFAAAWGLGVRRAGGANSPLEKKQVEDLIFYGAMGLVLGGRIGYVFFYNFGQFLDDPLWLFRVWEGGMSFHGGFLGVIVAFILYGRKINRRLIDLLDFTAPLAPLGLCCGRIGNFIGQELWGRATDLPWGMVFPRDSLQLVRHPSQLYEAFLEGIVLFVILYWFSSNPRPRGAVMGLGIMGYGMFRFAVEFLREPDAHIQFDLFGWMTRGQILSAPMVIVGATILIWALRNSSTAKFK